MHVSPLLLIHISSAVVGLLSGYLAMFLRKGSGWHQVAGTTFFVSMLSMTMSAAYIATFVHPIMINVVAASLTFYLVMTSWWTARRRDGNTGIVERALFLFGAVVALGGLSFGLQAVGNASGALDTVPAGIYFAFGTVALLHAISDGRMLLRGGVTGTSRIVRHLWRMCLALLITTLSMYPGQARQFSQAVRDSNVMWMPHVVLLGSIAFWLVRMRRRRRQAMASAIVAARETAIAERAAA